MAVRMETRDGFETTYEGATFATRERNYPDDSDFYAVVWTGERITEIEYATTRFGGTDHNSATADATPEVKAAADAWLVEWGFKVLRDADATEAQATAIGKVVKVRRTIRTRQCGPVLEGTEGMLLRLSVPHEAYSSWSRVTRGLVRLSDGRECWLNDYDLTTAHPEEYLSTEAELRERAEGFRGRYTAPSQLASAWSGMLVA